MSTTFEVYPQIQRVPLFGEIIDLVNKRLDIIWTNYDLSIRPLIKFELINEKTQERVIVSTDDPATWGEDHYLWVSFEEVGGGTDGYCNEVDELTVNVWDAYNEMTERRDEYVRCISNIRNSLEIGYYWSFRRSAGQPAIITLTYGLVASSFAQLTDGYIWSDDGAWEFNIFPASCNEFDLAYLNPDSAYLSPGNREWAIGIIETLIDEYK